MFLREIDYNETFTEIGYITTALQQSIRLDGYPCIQDSLKKWYPYQFWKLCL